MIDDSEGKSTIFLVVLVCTALAGSSGCSTPELMRTGLGYEVLRPQVVQESFGSPLDLTGGTAPLNVTYRASLESTALAQTDADGESTDSLAEEGATSSDSADADTDKWHFQLAPYLWAASLSGSGRIKGNRISGTASFSDIVKDLDFGAMGYLEASKDKWSLFVDGMFMEISDDVSVSLPGVSAEARTQLWLFHWGVLYKFAEISLEDTIEDSSIAFEALFGNRLYRLDAKLRLSPGPNPDESKTWIDPIIGMRIPWRLPHNFSLVTKGDIGGFGLGSHFSWQVQSLVRYDFDTKWPTFLAAGYRALGFNYSEGNGSTKLQFDLRFYGPIIGFGVAF